jgi:hypothetical protein
VRPESQVRRFDSCQIAEGLKKVYKNSTRNFNVQIPSTYIFSLAVQRISPEGSSKIQLQTVLHDGTSYSFHFVNNALPGAERRDRDEVKDLLAQLIPAHRKKANKDLEEKTK